MSDNKRIILNNQNGTVGIIIPSPGFSIEDLMATPAIKEQLSAAVSYEVVDVSVIPKSRALRDAWCACPEHKLRVDVDKAKEVCHKARRAVRSNELAPLDQLIAAKIPGKNESDVEAERQKIRDKHAAIQTEIDAATTDIELEAIINKIVTA